MEDISWGKPLIEYGATGADDAAPASFTAMPTCEENTALLTTNKGSLKELFGEGHERVAAKVEPSTYQFAMSVFLAKGATQPMTPADGIVEGYQCVRLTPEDDTLEGFIMRKTIVQVETEWSSAKGKMLKYTFYSVKPKTGDQLEAYTKPAE